MSISEPRFHAVIPREGGDLARCGAILPETPAFAGDHENLSMD